MIGSGCASCGRLLAEDLEEQKALSLRTTRKAIQVCVDLVLAEPEPQGPAPPNVMSLAPDVALIVGIRATKRSIVQALVKLEGLASAELSAIQGRTS